MIADVLGMELRFPTEMESAALRAAFQAGAAVVGMGVAEYVMGRSIEMEEGVVRPTEDKGVLALKAIGGIILGISLWHSILIQSDDSN